jgi:hypothetical protein
MGAGGGTFGAILPFRMLERVEVSLAGFDASCGASELATLRLGGVMT